MMISSGTGKHRVWLEKVDRLDGDIVLILGGGEKPHIGGVVLAVPGEDIELVNKAGHYDHHVLVPLAKAACKKYGTTVVVVGGVHIDDASKEDIEKVVENCRVLVGKL